MLGRAAWLDSALSGAAAEGRVASLSHSCRSCSSSGRGSRRPVVLRGSQAAPSNMPLGPPGGTQRHVMEPDSFFNMPLGPPGDTHQHVK